MRKKICALLPEQWDHLQSFLLSRSPIFTYIMFARFQDSSERSSELIYVEVLSESQSTVSVKRILLPRTKGIVRLASPEGRGCQNGEFHRRNYGAKGSANQTLWRWEGKKKKKPSYTAFANFHGATNTPNIANFKLPMWYHWTQS